MKKSTKNLIIGIGILSILSGIYAIFSNGDMSEIMFGFVIGASLIGSVYFDKYNYTE